MTSVDKFVQFPPHQVPSNYAPSLGLDPQEIDRALRELPEPFVHAPVLSAEQRIDQALSQMENEEQTPNIGWEGRFLAGMAQLRSELLLVVLWLLVFTSLWWSHGIGLIVFRTHYIFRT